MAISPLLDTRVPAFVVLAIVLSLVPHDMIWTATTLWRFSLACIIWATPPVPRPMFVLGYLKTADFSDLQYPNKNGEQWAVAELHRMQGDLLAAEGKAESAHASYLRGVEAARSVSLAFEQKLLILAGRTAVTASAERS